MRYLHVSLACLIAVAGTTATLAQDAQPATASSDSKPAKVRKICHQDVDTGSIMPHNTCHTKEEWAAISAQNQQQVDQALAHRGAGGGH